MFKDLIKITKEKRGFDTQKYLDEKLKAINTFFRDERLDAAVIGVSGGIDSAVVVKLLHEASKEADSPLKKVLAVAAPIYGSGVTNQDEAVNLALDMCESNEIECKIVDLTDAYTAIIRSCISGMVGGDRETTDWADGQMGSVLRTPLFYYQAAILQDHGYKSIVVGTTNRDEGSYIGFYGKASDAMVDLQPIADLHKSEVYKLATELNIPESILYATPRGDVWDGQVDEEMIGAPYWFLELYLQVREYDLWKEAKNMTDNEARLWYKYARRIETLHMKNEHKYKVGYPSRFIDVLPRALEGGWQ